MALHKGQWEKTPPFKIAEQLGGWETKRIDICNIATQGLVKVLHIKAIRYVSPTLLYQLGLVLQFKEVSTDNVIGRRRSGHSRETSRNSW